LSKAFRNRGTTEAIMAPPPKRPRPDDDDDGRREGVEPPPTKRAKPKRVDEMQSKKRAKSKRADVRQGHPVEVAAVSTGPTVKRSRPADEPEQGEGAEPPNKRQKVHDLGPGFDIRFRSPFSYVIAGEQLRNAARQSHCKCV
jgi:hypothetical protein